MWNGFYLRHTVGPHSLWFVCCLANIDTRYSGGWKERNVCHGLRLVTVVEKHLSNCRFRGDLEELFAISASPGLRLCILWQTVKTRDARIGCFFFGYLLFLYQKVTHPRVLISINSIWMPVLISLRLMLFVFVWAPFLLSYLLNLPQGILIGLINRGIPWLIFPTFGWICTN